MRNRRPADRKRPVARSLTTVDGVDEKLTHRTIVLGSTVPNADEATGGTFVGSGFMQVMKVDFVVEFYGIGNDTELLPHGERLTALMKAEIFAA